MPTALDPAELEFKGTALERYLSSKERLIRLRSLLALSRGLRASHRQGVGTSGWGRRRHLREPPTSTRPPGIPDATGCLRPESPARPGRPAAPGPGDWFTSGNRHTPKPGRASTRHRSSGQEGSSGEPETAEGRAGRDHKPHWGQSEEKERGGWKAGAEGRTAGDGDGAGEEEPASTHCEGRSSRGPHPLGRRGGCAGRSPRFCSTAAWGP